MFPVVAAAGRDITGEQLSLLMLSGTAGGAVFPYIAGRVLGGKVLGYTFSPDAMMQLLCATTMTSVGCLMAAVAAMPEKSRRD